MELHEIKQLIVKDFGVDPYSEQGKEFVSEILELLSQELYAEASQVLPKHDLSTFERAIDSAHETDNIEPVFVLAKHILPNFDSLFMDSYKQVKKLYKDLAAETQ